MRELFCIERDGLPVPGMAYRHRAVTERYIVKGANERVTRYLPEDVLALVSTRLEALLRQKMPAGLEKQIASIRAACEEAIGTV